MAPITTEELRLFHNIDRELFCRLIFKQKLGITQSLLVMGLWLWLENTGYPNIITTMMKLSDSMVKSLAKEAATCLNFLEVENPHIPIGGDLPLTRILVQRDISLMLFIEKRFVAIAGIRSILNNICARIFSDILRIILRSTNNTNIASTSRANSRPLVVPGFPHPLFGAFNVPPEIEDLDLSDERIWTSGRPSNHVTEEDKTMFLTFSRGFPVFEEEVRHLFTGLYGDCVRDLVMGNANANNQPMFATMVVDGVATVDRILNGSHIAKFRVNGKDIWARKYERRD